MSGFRTRPAPKQLILPKRFNPGFRVLDSFPEGGILDQSHPLAGDLIYWDNLRKPHITFLSGADHTFSARWGTGMHSTSTTTGGAYMDLNRYNRLEAIGANGDISMAVYASVDAVVDYSSLFSIPWHYDTTWAAPWYVWLFGKGATTVGSPSFAVTDVNDLTGQKGMIGTDDTYFDTSDGYPHVFSVQMKASGEIRFYKDGEYRDGNIGSIDAALPNRVINMDRTRAKNNPVHYMQRDQKNQGEGMTGKVFGAMIWNRALNDEGHAEIGKNFWGAFKPMKATKLYLQEPQKRFELPPQYRRQPALKAPFLDGLLGAWYFENGPSDFKRERGVIKTSAARAILKPEAVHKGDGYKEFRGGLKFDRAAATANASLGLLHDTEIGTSGATVLVVRRPLDKDLTNETSAFGIHDGGTFTRRLGAHVPWTDGTVYWDFGGTGASNRLSWAGYSKDPAIVDRFVFAAGANGARIGYNGQIVATNGTARTRTLNSETLYLGEGNGTNDSQIEGDNVEVYMFAVWNKQLTDEQIETLSADPFALFGRSAPSYMSYDPLEVATKIGRLDDPTELTQANYGNAGAYVYPVGTNRLTLMAIYGEDGVDSTISVDSVTELTGSKAWTKVQDVTINLNDDVSLWYLKDADIPANNISGGFSIATTDYPALWTIKIFTLELVDQTSPVVSSGYGNGSAKSVSETPVTEAGGWLGMFLLEINTIPGIYNWPHGSEVLNSDDGGYQSLIGEKVPTEAGSDTIAWTQVATQIYRYIYAAFRFSEEAALAQYRYRRKQIDQLWRF